MLMPREAALSLPVCGIPWLSALLAAALVLFVDKFDPDAMIAKSLEFFLLVVGGVAILT